jgi:predicted GTPase
MLHQVVAHFLRVRFPTLLVLNKADLPPAASHIAQLRTLLPFESMIAVSARRYDMFFMT